MILKQILNGVAKIFSESPYKQDAELVEKYLGIELTEMQFDSYKDKATLRDSLGTNSQIYNKYYGYGISAQFSKIDVMNDILDHLSNSGIVFDIEQESNKQLFKKLSQSAQFCLTQDQWPRIHDIYRDSTCLIEDVKNMRSQMNLSKMNIAL